MPKAGQRPALRIGGQRGHGSAPVPLQERSWFYGFVLLLLLAIGWLGWQSINQYREIAATNNTLRQEIAVRQQMESALQRSHEQLEQRVRDRTAELTRVNESLNREIHERQQAEEARRRLEAQFHQSQKMEAIGTLAGGIAHDFNNVLAVIMLYCQILHDEIPGHLELREHIEEMLKATQRAKGLIQQILTFSRQQQHDCRIMKLEPVVNDAFKMLRSMLPSTIDMVAHFKPAPPVLVDPNQIHQVIMNLCVNAQHALAGNRGSIEIGLDEISVDAAFCVRNPDLRPGTYARLTVRDNGQGMTREILQRIFEPFFTTKPPGQGPGLGLAVVHGIVKNCNGAILVESQAGQGTAFHVFLPAQNDPVKFDAEATKPAPQSAGGHILIVDDETAIARVLARFLVKNGYQVTTHTESKAALEAFQNNPTGFDLMLTDLTMPEMDGLELARKVTAIRPGFPVVMATGFGGNLTSESPAVERGNIRKIVQKPFSPQFILQLVSEILQPPAPSQG